MPDLQTMWAVLLAGMAVVFILLIVLIVLVRKNGSAGSALRKEPESVPAARKPAPFVEEGIPGEVVAAVAAAVYCLYGDGSRSVVSIRRQSPTGRSAWEMAGLLENTRPF